MNKLSSLATLASMGLIAGCATGPENTDGPASPSSSQAIVAEPTVGVDASIDANLQALRDLHVFEVRDVAVYLPENANCYNLPCPGHEKEFVSYADARAHAAAGLEQFTRTAVAAASDATLDARIADSGHCYDTDEENLAALRALRVVVLGDVVLEAPGQNPNCYWAPYGQKLARIAAAFRKP